jgi:hypothetical protein
VQLSTANGTKLGMKLQRNPTTGVGPSVGSVDPSGQAKHTGQIHAGDVITHINGAEVRTWSIKDVAVLIKATTMLEFTFEPAGGFVPSSPTSQGVATAQTTEHDDAVPLILKTTGSSGRVRTSVYGGFSDVDVTAVDATAAPVAAAPSATEQLAKGRSEQRASAWLDVAELPEFDEDVSDNGRPTSVIHVAPSSLPVFPSELERNVRAKLFKGFETAGVSDVTLGGGGGSGTDAADSPYLVRKLSTNIRPGDGGPR